MLPLFRSFARWFVYASFGVLVSCSTNLTSHDSSLSQETLWQHHQEALQNISTFTVEGSLSYRDPQHREYGRFRLNYQGEKEYQFRITSPIGTTVLQLNVTPYDAQLIDSNGQHYHDQDVEHLITALTQMVIPLHDLSQWLLGISDRFQPNATSPQGWVTSGSLVSRSGDVWRWSASNYKHISALNAALPSLIQLTQGDIQIQIKLTRWSA